MYPWRLTTLLAICLLLCVGSGWAKPTYVENTEVSSSSLSTSSSLSGSPPKFKTSPAEPTNTGDGVTTSMTGDKSGTITSTPDTVSSASLRSDTSTEDSASTLSSPSSTEESKSTGRGLRTSFVSHTTAQSGGKSDSTSVTSTPGSMNVTTNSPNLTTNSSVLSIPTSLSMTTALNNWTFPGNTSPQSNATTAAGAYHQPGHCAVGSDCAWKLGIGLSFGSTFAVAIFFLIGRRYRQHLEDSHREHHNNWNNRDNASDEFEPPGEHQEAIKMVDTLDTAATTPHDEGIDELYLPEDVQRVVDRVAEMQRQKTRLPADAYGSMRRKPLPAYSDGI